MFKKVLIAEDHEIANISVRRTLQELGIVDTNYVFYCDTALTWIKNGLRDGQPYDLLITDLSFEEDNTPQVLKGGIDLIQAVKQVQPDLKIIVFSAENRPAQIEELFSNQAINAYVRKARKDAEHLKDALHQVAAGHTYQSPDIKQAIREKNTHEFSTLDIHIINLLAQGVLQKNIPTHLQEKNIRPSGLSSVEKRLSLMKEVLDFTKNEQLVIYCRDKGLI